MTTIGKKLFCIDLDNVASRWLKTTGPGDAQAFTHDMDNARASAAEALLISPRTTFRVTGENVVLSQLVAIFGPKAVMELLDEHAIEFVLWRSFVGTTEEPIDGLHLFATMNLGDVSPDATAEHRMSQAVFCDPEASAEAGLAHWLAKLLNRSTRRDLARLASKRTVVTDRDAPDWAVDRVRTAFMTGELAYSGMVPGKELSLDQQKQMVTWAAQLAAAVILLENGCDLYETPEYWDTLMMLYTRLIERDKARTVTEQIISIPDGISIPNLLSEGTISFQEIPRLRKERGPIEYREWLWSQPNVEDANEVTKAYMRGLVKKPITDHRWFRPTHLLIGQAIGLTVAAKLASVGLPDSAGLAAGEAASVAIAVADDFIVSKLSRTQNPYLFAHDVIGPRVDRLRANQAVDHMDMA